MAAGVSVGRDREKLMTRRDVGSQIELPFKETVVQVSSRSKYLSRDNSCFGGTR